MLVDLRTSSRRILSQRPRGQPVCKAQTTRLRSHLSCCRHLHYYLASSAVLEPLSQARPPPAPLVTASSRGATWGPTGLVIISSQFGNLGTIGCSSPQSDHIPKSEQERCLSGCGNHAPSRLDVPSSRRRFKSSRHNHDNAIRRDRPHDSRSSGNCNCAFLL